MNSHKQKKRKIAATKMATNSHAPACHALEYKTACFTVPSSNEIQLNPEPWSLQLGAGSIKFNAISREPLVKLVQFSKHTLRFLGAHLSKWRLIQQKIMRSWRTPFGKLVQNSWTPTKFPGGTFAKMIRIVKNPMKFEGVPLAKQMRIQRNPMNSWGGPVAEYVDMTCAIHIMGTNAA